MFFYERTKEELYLLPAYYMFAVHINKFILDLRRTKLFLQLALNIFTLHCDGNLSRAKLEASSSRSRSVEYLTVVYIPSFGNILISFRTSLLLESYNVRILANMNRLAFRLATYKNKGLRKKKKNSCRCVDCEEKKISGGSSLTESFIPFLFLFFK